MHTGDHVLAHVLTDRRRRVTEAPSQGYFDRDSQELYRSGATWPGCSERTRPTTPTDCPTGPTGGGRLTGGSRCGGSVGGPWPSFASPAGWVYSFGSGRLALAAPGPQWLGRRQGS